MDMGRELESADRNLSFSLYSRFPFPWNADRKLDSFELASLRVFERGGESAVEEAVGANGTTIIRYAVPVKMKHPCVDCHNQPDFGQERAWQVGDLRGA